TCGDLFFQSSLLESAEKELENILKRTKYTSIAACVGMPVIHNGRIFNCGVVIQAGRVLGAVPKSYLPNYAEFYEKRWFASGKGISTEITLAGARVPFGDDLIFEADGNEECSFAVEICEDLWAVSPPSCGYSQGGAHMIFNLSASNDLVGKYEYRKKLIEQQSARCICGYVYASASSGESTTDLVFGGHCLAAENGRILAESERFDFDGHSLITEIDTGLIGHDRRKNNVFTDLGKFNSYRRISYLLNNIEAAGLSRYVDPHPFVPGDEGKRKKRCREILEIQSTGLAKRMRHTGIGKAVIGISGGLDSTLALLVASMACEKLNLDSKSIIAVTMPGFGTSGRTYGNAVKLIKLMGAEFREIDITESCISHFKRIGHDETIHDLTYENVQARERTRILMDIAGKENGLVVGTGDMSELALGWATYNGDHMSMYGVNCSVPKTLVRYLIGFAADNEKNEEIAGVLRDIMDTPVSPELLPAENGVIMQVTEDIIGPYELHDFFLYNFVRCGFGPEKIKYLAEIAFAGKYEPAEILEWLRIFIKRFFSQQYKRSCIPDGPKVGSVSLSPRGDWRMPSDASGTDWLKKL
ncbi:MAG: NAD(+) synthase, partial [Clostridia bacterium]|nr:NAD(+) synthase [Clostridia bacterium]